MRHRRHAYCCVGDKDPVCCQSDDQFTVFNHAIKNGMEVILSPAHAAPVVLITVAKLGVRNAPPFDYDLHKVAESLR